MPFIHDVSKLPNRASYACRYTCMVHVWTYIALRLYRDSELWTPRTAIYWIFTVEYFVGKKHLIIPRHMMVAGYCGWSSLFVFSFSDDNLCECQWIFTKLGVCNDIVEIWFQIANGQISSAYDSITTTHQIFGFRTITLVNLYRFSPNLISALILRRSGLGLLLGTFHQFLTVISPWHNNGGILLLHILYGVIIICNRGVVNE